MNSRQEKRMGILRSFGASASVIEELLASGEPHQRGANEPCGLPLKPELHLVVWEEYAAEARSRGAWEVLQSRLPQMWFPVARGISQTESYRAATRRGESARPSSGLVLRCPEQLRLWVQDSLGGPIPVLATAERTDFMSLVQALSCRNEPESLPDSMGACLIVGLNNWDRIGRLRDRWLAEGGTELSWRAELRRIIPATELYQDRLLVLSEGPYSNIPACDMGMSSAEWLQTSFVIRLAHECTHYLALRLFGALLDRPVDEVIADYVGIAASCGRFRADWFLRFMGLEDFPNYQQGRRLENYRGQPPMSDDAFQVLQGLVRAAALNMERFDAEHFGDSRQPRDRALLAPALSRLTLEEMASPTFLKTMKQAT
jgi:hypothetical protein